MEQREDRTAAIDTLLEDINAGRKYMKVYRQMKLYNDPRQIRCFCKRKINQEIFSSAVSRLLGDVAMTLPSVYNACYANPHDNFYFLTRSHPAQVFINKPENLSVIGIDLDNYKGVAGIWRLARAH